MLMPCWLRSCVMERTLALESDIRVSNLTNSPGWSGITVSKKTLRHDRSRPLLMTRVILFTSILPPLTKAATFLLRIPEILPFINAATGTAPAPSDTVLTRSINQRMAPAISVSSTVTISSTYFLQISYVTSPGVFTVMPSARLALPFTVKICPWSIDSFIDGIFSVWTPITLIFGFTFLAATANPEIRPPPPIGATMTSTSGSCSIISNEIVP